MSIRLMLAAVAVVFTFTAVPAEAGGTKRVAKAPAAKAAPAPRADCPLRAMMHRLHDRMHHRMHAERHTKVAAAKPAKAKKPLK